MKRFKPGALLLAIVMAWVSYASNSFAFSMSQPAQAAMVMDHGSMDMATMNMQDCPGHKDGGMKMDAGKCAVSCYGLITSVIHNPLPMVADMGAVEDRPQIFHGKALMSRALGVPTPPPNFA